MPLFRRSTDKTTAPRSIKAVVDSFSSAYAHAKNVEKDGKKEEAVTLYKKALDSLANLNADQVPETERKNISDILYSISNTLVMLENIELSRSSFELALKFDPSNSKGIYSYAKLFLERGEDTLSLEKLLKEAIEGNPGSDELQVALGEVYERNGKREDAINAYNKALELNPNNAEIAERLMNFYEGDEISQKKYLELLRKTGDRERILEAYIHMINEGRLEMLEEAKNVLPNEPRLYSIEAKMLIDDGKIDLAKAKIKEILSMDPDSVEGNMLEEYIEVLDSISPEEQPIELRISKMISKGNIGDAIEIARKAGLSNEDIFFIALNGGDYDYSLKLASSFHNPTAHRCLVLAETDVDEAEREMNAYVANNQKDPFAWVVKSIIADYKGNELGTRNFLNMALRLEPKILKENYIGRFKNFKDEDWFNQLKKQILP